MTSKKLVSIIVVIAGLCLLIGLIEVLRGNSSQKTLPTTVQVSGAPTREQVQKDLYSAEDDAKWQTFKLSILRSGAAPDPQQIATQEQNVTLAVAALNKAENDAYTDSKDAVSKTDIILTTDAQINDKKQDMNSILATWESEIASGNPPTSDVIQQYLQELQADLNDINTIVEGLTIDGSDLTQEQINSYEVVLQSAIDEIQDSITELEDAESNEQNAEETLSADQSVGDQSAINTQTNAVIDAEATVANLEDELSSMPASPDPTQDAPAPGTEYIPTDTPPAVLFVAPYDPDIPHLRQD